MKTTNQLISAPRNAVFVWCTSNLLYPRNLAKFLGRVDITVVSVNTLDRAEFFYGSRIKDVVIDHACRPSVKGASVMEDLRANGINIK